MRIIFFQQFHCILQIPGLHRHNILEPIDIAHLKVQAGVFIQVTLGIVLLCPEYRGCLKYSVKYAYHHLLIELGALSKNRRPVEIFQLEDIRAAFRTFRSNLWRMNLRKSLTVKEVPESTRQSFLDSEFGTLSYVSKRNGTVI